MKATQWFAIGATLGALGVAVGAFGAHASPKILESLGYDAAEITKRLATLETGVRYQMYCAAALLAVGIGKHQWSGKERPDSSWSVAGWLLLVGGLIFSHLLYALTFVGPDYRWLGAVVPIGGVGMIAGWVMLAVAALRSRPDRA